MKDKDILDMLGLNDRTITLSADDEYLQIMLEKKIDNYLKKLDEEKMDILYMYMFASICTIPAYLVCS